MSVGERQELKYDFDPYRDSLTGLLNYEGFKLEYNRLHEAMPGNFALVFIDLDKLKQVNDTEGHEAGNELIKAAAQTLSHELRTSEEGGSDIETREQSAPPDIVTAARYGGDEFIILLPGINDSSQLDVVLDRIRANFTEADISASVDGKLHICGEEGHTLIDRADAGMRQDKVSRKKAEFEALPRRKKIAANMGAKLLRYAGINPPRQ